ncbi:MAG: N-acetylneuraminate synthase family protein [Desulfovibrionaceae bacterium]
MKPTPTLTLRSGVTIGHGHPCFVVAEVGNNHQGDFAIACRMVEAAAAAGVNGVKFQKRHMPSLLTDQGMQAPYTGPNSFGATYGAHRAALELDLDQMAKLKALAEEKGMVFFASSWDIVSLEEMARLDVELLKICSADLVNVPLLRKTAAQGAPIIMSTGMSTLDQVDNAVDELRAFHSDIALLHCNSSYPCAETDICLPVMRTLRDRYNLPVGYSGHEKGLGPSVAAVALGACIVERHFTLDRSQRGTDHQASLEPDDFARLVAMIRETEQAVLCDQKRIFPTEAATAAKLRKSVVAASDLAPGRVLGNGDLTVKSPGTGISPLRWDEIMGATLIKPLAKDQQLTWDMISKP